MIKINGFSLIELIIALALTAIVITLAVPGYQTLIATNHVQSKVDELVTAIHFARSEAIKRHTTITLCKSLDTKQCGGKWQDGWIIFVDKTAQGYVGRTDDILRVVQYTTKTDRLEWHGSRSNNYLQINPDGTTRGQDGSFIYETQAGYSSKIVISLTGRVRVENLGKQ